MNDDDRPTYIYVLIDPRDGESRYVGKTVLKLQYRLTSHLRTKENNYRGYWIQSLIQQGIEPVIKLIETVPVGGDWAEREKYWIAYYRSIGANLTNATDGGEGVTGLRHTNESRAKISRAELGRKQSPESIEKGRKKRLGRKATSETRKKLQQSHLGKRQSSETKEKIRQARLGRTLSDETREKLRQARLGKRATPEARENMSKARMKPVTQYTLDDKYIREWESAKDASKETGIHKNSISACCRKELKSAGGFIWKYTGT